jgi:hypothetical protein
MRLIHQIPIIYFLITTITTSSTTADYLTDRLQNITNFYKAYLNSATKLPIYNLNVTNSSALNTNNNAFMTRNPMQSFHILMNFNFDGTTGLVLMDQDNQVFWTDRGYCPHGYMYDPLNNICRQIFCTEGN